METKNFDTELNAIYRELGFDSVKETATDWFYNVETDKYEYDENGFFYFLYDVVNYDLISLHDGKIDVSNSNHEDIANFCKRWASKETVKQVANRLGRE